MVDAILPPTGRCLACALGVSPHLIVRHPDGEHLGCRDWRRVPWPYEKLERRLRARFIALRRASSSIEELGRWLGDRRRRWPDRAADTVLEITRRLEELRRALDRAGVRWPTWR